MTARKVSSKSDPVFLQSSLPRNVVETKVPKVKNTKKILLSKHLLQVPLKSGHQTTEIGRSCSVTGGGVGIEGELILIERGISGSKQEMVHFG